MHGHEAWKKEEGTSELEEDEDAEKVGAVLGRGEPWSGDSTERREATKGVKQRGLLRMTQTTA